MRTVVCKGFGRGRRVEVAARGHAFVMDEPEFTDQGPTPYEALLAALGSCTVMTCTAYAERKGWPLQGVDITLTQDKVEVPGPAGTPVRRDRLTRAIRFDGPLDDEQRARLLEIAEKCPVHKALVGGPMDVVTTAV